MEQQDLNRRLILALVLSFFVFVGYSYIFPPAKQEIINVDSVTKTEQKDISHPSPTQISAKTPANTQQTSTVAPVSDDSKILLNVKSELFHMEIDVLGRISKFTLLQDKYDDEDGKKLQILGINKVKPLELRFSDPSLNSEAFKIQYTFDGSQTLEISDKPKTIVLVQTLSTLTISKTITISSNGEYSIEVKTSQPSQYFITPGHRPMADDSMYMLVRGALIKGADDIITVLHLVERVASSDVPVLVYGESGTGKELVARAVHDASPRREGPYVSENCSAIPESLLESALFGHVQGAFTGADRARRGLFEIADGGTLFLDEIGEMSDSMQAKLLRVLQDGQLRPIGSERVRTVDVRLVAATHRDLPALVEAGRFRQDLFYRIAVVQVELPPLRERPDDIAPLVAAFLERHAAGTRVRMEPSTMNALRRHRWPGNVRELENEIRRALVLADGIITVDHLSPAVRGDGDTEPLDELDLKGRVASLERRLIRRALEQTAGNQTRAAKLLGVSRYGLQKMIKRLGVSR